MADKQEARHDRIRRGLVMLASTRAPGPRGPPVSA